MDIILFGLVVMSFQLAIISYQLGRILKKMSDTKGVEE